MEKVRHLLAEAERWVEAHRQEMVEELAEWARIPSVSRADQTQPGAPFGPECRRMLDYAMARGQHWGFPAEDHDGYACSLTLGNGENCLGLVVHLDVVPAGEGWVYPPFGSTWLPEHDVMIGRGVDDNKGSAIAALFALRMIRDLGWPLKHGVKLLCGVSEETGMQDMKHLRQAGMRFPKASLVPDAGFPVNYGQKGSIDADLAFSCAGDVTAFDAGDARNSIPDAARCRLALPCGRVQSAFAGLDAALTAPLTIAPDGAGTVVIASGQAGHAAFPAAADNAIHRLSAALAASELLQGVEVQTMQHVAALTADAFGRSEGVACRDDVSGELTLAYTVAHLADGVLTLQADCRYPITCDADALENALRRHWAQCGARVTLLERSDAYYIDPNGPLVQTLQRVYQAATGRDDPPYTMGGGTYSKAVPNAISFGPGMPGKRYDFSAFLPAGHGRYHGPDEAVCMEKVRDCCRIIAVAIAALDDVVG